MKNVIIAIVAIIGISATAQQKKSIVPAKKSEVIVTENLSPEETGKNNLAALAAFTPLNQDQKNVLLELFTTKTRMRNETATDLPQELQNLSKIISSKMESVIAGDVMEKIRANKALFAQLTN